MCMVCETESGGKEGQGGREAGRNAGKGGGEGGREGERERERQTPMHLQIAYLNYILCK